MVGTPTGIHAAMATTRCECSPRSSFRCSASLGLRTDTIGVLGWSMGGYGALLFAREANRGTLSSGALGPHCRRRGRCQQPCAVLFVSRECERRVRQPSRFREVRQPRELNPTPARPHCMSGAETPTHSPGRHVDTARTCLHSRLAASPRAVTPVATGDRSPRRRSASWVTTSRERAQIRPLLAKHVPVPRPRCHTFLGKQREPAGRPPETR